MIRTLFIKSAEITRRRKESVPEPSYVNIGNAQARDSALSKKQQRERAEQAREAHVQAMAKLLVLPVAQNLFLKAAKLFPADEVCIQGDDLVIMGVRVSRPYDIDNVKVVSGGEQAMRFVRDLVKGVNEEVAGG